MKKRVKIIHKEHNWPAAEWHYEILRNYTEKTYKAQLILYDEYDGHLVQEKVYASSSAFNTLEEADAYALEHWVGKIIE